MIEQINLDGKLGTKNNLEIQEMLKIKKGLENQIQELNEKINLLYLKEEAKEKIPSFKEKIGQYIKEIEDLNKRNKDQKLNKEELCQYFKDGSFDKEVELKEEVALFLKSKETAVLIEVCKDENPELYKEILEKFEILKRISKSV